MPATSFPVSREWRTLITTLTHVNVTFLDRLAADREFTYAIGQAAQATATVPSDNPEVNLIYDSTTDPFVSHSNRFLIGFRRELDGPLFYVPRFCGLLEILGDDGDTDKEYTHLTAYDPRRYWGSRPLVTAQGVLLPPDGRVFYSTPGSTILTTLLADCEAAHGSLFADYGQTAFYAGTIETTATIDKIGFEQATSLGEAVTQLEDTGTMDVILTPIYDPFVRPGLIVEVNVYATAGQDRAGAVMGWDAGENTLAAINRVQDGTQMANKVAPYNSQGGRAGLVQTDATSVTKYGQYWSQQVLTQQISKSASEILAAAQLALRKNGKQTLTITPDPERSPEPFLDYFLGDRIPVLASSKLREAISSNQRVYGIPIRPSDDRVESVGPLLLSPGGV